MAVTNLSCWWQYYLHNLKLLFVQLLLLHTIIYYSLHGFTLYIRQICNYTVISNTRNCLETSIALLLTVYMNPLQCFRSISMGSIHIRADSSNTLFPVTTQIRYNSFDNTDLCAVFLYIDIDTRGWMTVAQQNRVIQRLLLVLYVYSFLRSNHVKLLGSIMYGSKCSSETN